jgi:hypothetical protein
MSLKPGDWVRTVDGDVGQIVTLKTSCAFVRITKDNSENVAMFLLSELTPVDPPHTSDRPAN